MLINYLMQRPLLYNLTQQILARNGSNFFKRLLIKESNINVKNVLDLGCGTGEYAKIFTNKNFVGIDNNPKDIGYAVKNYSGRFIVASAADVPFKKDSFDLVFSIGLHHHLNDLLAKKSIIESLRVVKQRGKIIIIDAVLPSVLSNPIGYILRKLDRGKYVRKIDGTLNLINPKVKYTYEVLHKFPLDYIIITINNNAKEDKKEK